MVAVTILEAIAEAIGAALGQAVVVIITGIIGGIISGITGRRVNLATPAARQGSRKPSVTQGQGTALCVCVCVCVVPGRGSGGRGAVLVCMSVLTDGFREVCICMCKNTLVAIGLVHSSLVVQSSD